MPSQDPDLPRLLTTDEVAGLLRVNPKTITRWVKAGHLPAVRLPGGQLRFLPEDVQALMNREAPRE